MSGNLKRFTMVCMCYFTLIFTECVYESEDSNTRTQPPVFEISDGSHTAYNGNSATGRISLEKC